MTHQLPRPVSTADGVWVQFDIESEPVLVRSDQWVGFDFDGVLSMERPGVELKLQDLGIPVYPMVDWAKKLVRAGVRVKIFTARACEPHNGNRIQDWTEQHGLGRLEVTNAKDYGLICYYDDRAIQVIPVLGESVKAQIRNKHSNTGPDCSIQAVFHRIKNHAAN